MKLLKKFLKTVNTEVKEFKKTVNWIRDNIHINIKQKLKEEMREFKRTIHWLRTGDKGIVSTIYDVNLNEVCTTKVWL